MSYEVDKSGGSFASNQGFNEYITATWPNEIAPNQWFRLEKALDPSQGPDLPGASPYYINPSGTPYGITAGPDGNLWFNDGPGFIGHMTPAGKVPLFPLPLATSVVGSITPSPNGALWFSECVSPGPIGCAASKIGRIST